jgi:hypothetical protein
MTVPRRLARAFWQIADSDPADEGAHDAGADLCFRRGCRILMMRCLGAMSLSAVVLASTPANAAALNNANDPSVVVGQRQQGERPDTLQGEPGSGRMRLAAEALRALHEEVFRIAQSQTTTNEKTILPRGNPLDGTSAPRCLLGNGVTLQTSGGFRPYYPTSDCRNQ